MCSKDDEIVTERTIENDIERERGKGVEKEINRERQVHRANLFV